MPVNSTLPPDMFSFMPTALERALNDEELRQLNEANVGLDRLLGLRYTYVELGKVVSELHVAAKHLQPAGLVNGGVFSAVAESTASFAGIIAARGKTVVGVNNNTDFISSVRSGVIVASASAIQLGGRTQVWQVLCTHRGELVARTTLRTMVLG